VIKLLIPNTTQVPNVIFDEIMPNLKPAAFKVLLLIVRQTYGWRKVSDRIGLTTIQKATGLSREGVIKGIKDLGELITVKPGRREIKEANEYSLNLDISTGQLVRKVDQSEKLTSQNSPPLTSQQSSHSETYKKKPNRVKGKPSRSDGSDPRVKEFIDWWHQEYRKRFSNPYRFSGGKEGRLIKDLLQDYDLPRLRDIAGLFLDSTDPWVQQTGGYTLGVFASQINKLVSTSKGNPSQRKELPV